MFRKVLSQNRLNVRFLHSHTSALNGSSIFKLTNVLQYHVNQSAVKERVWPSNSPSQESLLSLEPQINEKVINIPVESSPTSLSSSSSSTLPIERIEGIKLDEKIILRLNSYHRLKLLNILRFIGIRTSGYGASSQDLRLMIWKYHQDGFIEVNEERRKMLAVTEKQCEKFCYKYYKKLQRWDFPEYYRDHYELFKDKYPTLDDCIKEMRQNLMIKQFNKRYSRYIYPQLKCTQPFVTHTSKEVPLIHPNNGELPNYLNIFESFLKTGSILKYLETSYTNGSIFKPETTSSVRDNRYDFSMDTSPELHIQYLKDRINSIQTDQKKVFKSQKGVDLFTIDFFEKCIASLVENPNQIVFDHETTKLLINVAMTYYERKEKVIQIQRSATKDVLNKENIANSEMIPSESSLPPPTNTVESRKKIHYEGQMTVVGDLHGHLANFIQICSTLSGMPSKTNRFVFLGNVIDDQLIQLKEKTVVINEKSLELLYLLLALKMALPQSVHILKGRKEYELEMKLPELIKQARAVLAIPTIRYGEARIAMKKEKKSKHDSLDNLERLHKLLCALPVVGVLESKILLINSSLGPISSKMTISELSEVLSPLQSSNQSRSEEVLKELLMRDPIMEEATSKKSLSIKDIRARISNMVESEKSSFFSQKLVRNFLKTHKFSYMIRGENGFYENSTEKKYDRIYSLLSARSGTTTGKFKNCSILQFKHPENLKYTLVKYDNF